MKEPKRAVIYCRVSTKEQVEEGNSLVTQEKLCREFAYKNEYTIAHTFIEMGESAKTADRTELQKLLKLCADKKENISAVIAYKIDRLSRNTDDYSQIRLLLKRYGVEIKSTSEPFENTPAGRFMENIIANVAQFDNEVRAERCVGGMKQAVAEGRYVWKAPLGYSNTKIDGKATIAPNSDASIVQDTFDYFIQYECSINAVQRYITTKYLLKLSRSRFYKLLKNPIYIGKIQKFNTVVDGNFEGIVPLHKFNKVQQLLSSKTKHRTYNKIHPDFPLRRFIKTTSGKSLTGCWCKGRRNKYPYYRLPDNGKLFNKGEVEALFIHYLNSFGINEEQFKDFEMLVNTKFNNKFSNEDKQQKALLTNKERLLIKRKQLLEKNVDGIIDDAILKEQLEICDERISVINTELQQEKKSLDTTQILDFTKQFLDSPGDFWKDLPPAAKEPFQWFAFPNGLQFDGNFFQTTKTANVFKVKSVFLSALSSLVDEERQHFKHLDKVEFSGQQLEDLESLLKDIQSDIEQERNKKKEIIPIIKFYKKAA